MECDLSNSEIKKRKKKKHRGSIRISRKIAKRHNPCFDEAHRKKIRHEDERRAPVISLDGVQTGNHGGYEIKIQNKRREATRSLIPTGQFNPKIKQSITI